MKRQRKPEYKIGDEIGWWTIVSEPFYADDYKFKGQVRKYLCRCKCGLEKELFRDNLLSGRTECCRDCVHLKRNPPEDFLGKKFSNWTTIEYLGFNSYRKRTFKVRCDCGYERNFTCRDLKKEVHAFCKKCQTKQKALNTEFLVYKRIRRQAPIRNLIFNIELEETMNLLEKQNFKCALSGVKLELGANCRDVKNITASIDRIDSSKGYTIDNVQWVHKDINRMKGAKTDEEFIQWCKLVTENNKDVE